jgi:HK97 gp10 family phage protein
MGDFELSAEMRGHDAVRGKMEQVVQDMTGEPMRAGMARATLLVQRDARKNAPVDRGPLRASITPEVVVQSNTVQGIVGSNVKYAPYQELGTRSFTPPWMPIYRWALRKVGGAKRAAGALASAVRASIRIRGIRAKRYLQSAVEDNADRIYRLIGEAVAHIVEK